MDLESPTDNGYKQNQMTDVQMTSSHLNIIRFMNNREPDMICHPDQFIFHTDFILHQGIIRCPDIRHQDILKRLFFSYSRIMPERLYGRIRISYEIPRYMLY